MELVLDTKPLSAIDARETLQGLDRQHQRLSQLVQDLLLLTRLDRQITPNGKQSRCL